jgi:hypothetical protein
MQVSWGPHGFFKIDYEGELEPIMNHVLLTLLVFSVSPDTNGILGSRTRARTHTHTHNCGFRI